MHIKYFLVNYTLNKMIWFTIESILVIIQNNIVWCNSKYQNILTKTTKRKKATWLFDCNLYLVLHFSRCFSFPFYFIDRANGFTFYCCVNHKCSIVRLNTHTHTILFGSYACNSCTYIFAPAMRYVNILSR